MVDYLVIVSNSSRPSLGCFEQLTYGRYIKYASRNNCHRRYSNGRSECFWGLIAILWDTGYRCQAALLKRSTIQRAGGKQGARLRAIALGQATKWEDGEAHASSIRIMFGILGLLKPAKSFYDRALGRT